jgi:hypothetical protein
VIYGTVDPLVHPNAGRDTAASIPGANLLMIEGMDHTDPDVATDQRCDRVSCAERCERISIARAHLCCASGTTSSPACLKQERKIIHFVYSETLQFTPGLRCHRHGEIRYGGDVVRYRRSFRPTSDQAARPL